MLNIDNIKAKVKDVAPDYGIKKVLLFGSYADGRSTEESDIDLLVEFEQEQISLFELSALKLRLESEFSNHVDIIHYPMPNNAMLEIDRTVAIYG